MSLTHALDVSHYQGAVLWGSLRDKYGLTWSACKATEGSSFVDSQFARNWAGLKAAGLGRAAYHYAHPDQSATAQADLFVATVKPVPGDVLVLDLETGTTQTATNAWAIAFSARVRALAPGIPLWLYMGMGYAASNTGRGLSHHYDRWWVAHYWGPQSAWPTTFEPRIGGNTTGWAAPHIWQWSQALDGRYDADVSELTFNELAGADAVTPAEIEAVAAAVWAYPLASKRPSTPGQMVAAGPYLTSIDANTSTALPIVAAVQTLTQAIAAAQPGQQQALVDAITTTLQTSIVKVEVVQGGPTP